MRPRGKAQARLLLPSAMLASASGLASAAETIGYSYDPHGRLTGVARSGSSTLATQYRHDLADNRTSRWTGTGAPPAPPAPAPPAFSIDDVAAGEGNDLIFTVTRHGSINASYSVGYTTAAGTAAAGTDYSSASGPLTFGPDDFSRTVIVHSTADNAFEPDETLFVNLSGATGGATIVDSQGAGLIVNDDSSNQPPVTANDFAATALCGEGVSVDVVANDSDPDGHYPLALDAIVSATRGEAAIESAANILFTPTSPGTGIVTYRIRDSLGATATGTLSVTITGQGPCQ
jgi:YD repeat-containing protein